MITINITVASCRATLAGTPTIVCGNKEKYYIKFVFDGEWGANTAKTARFVWVAGGKLQQTDVIFTGDTVAVPELVGTTEVKVGVFEGDLQTTTPARIYCERSIRCYGGEPAEETPGQYDHIMTLYNQALEQQAAADIAADTAKKAAQAATASQSKVEAIVAGNEAYTKNEADGRAAPAIVQTAAGAAIAARDAAARPLQALVLHGGATQAGTPTPDAPQELVPAVKAGPVNVMICGKNLLQLTTGGRVTGVTETISNGMVSFDGTAEGSGGRTAWRRSNIVTLSPGTYRLSMIVPSGTAGTPCLTKANSVEIVASNGGPFTITEPVDVYLGFNYEPGVTYNAKNVKVQLERGSVATDYEEYKEPQALAIDAPAMYAGSLDVLTGQALYAGIVELGAGEWGPGRASSGWAHGYETVGKDTIALHHHLGDEKAGYYPPTLCSHFPAASTWGEIVGAGTEMAYRGNSNGLAYVAVRIKRSRLAEYGFVDDGTGKTAVAAFQAWLEAQAAAGTPVQFVGEINNTAERGVKSAQSYKPTTTVVNDAGAAMTVAYVADTAEYITAYLAKKYPSFEEVAF